MADFSAVIEQLKQNKIKNEASLEDVKTAVEIGTGIYIRRDTQRETNQRRVEGGRKAWETRQANLAAKAAEATALAVDKQVEQSSFLSNIVEFSKKQLSIAEKDRADKQKEKLKKLEKVREAKTVGKAKDAARDLVGDDIKEPAFLSKIFKLALGVFGAAVFVKLVQNFDNVKAFTKDKLIPALKSTFTFLKETLTPVFNFISNNFPEVVTGVAVAAGAVIATKVFIKLANLFKSMRIALAMVRTGMLLTYQSVLFTGKSLIETSKNLGGKLMKGLKTLLTAAKAFRIFMFATFLPAMVTGFATMVTTMYTTMVGFLASITPMLIVAAPFIAIGAAIVAVFAGMIFLLTKLRDSLGFDSIFDVLMLGVMHLKDAFGHVVNLVGSIVNFILGLVEKFGKFLGFEVDLPKIPKMATDSAERFKEEAREEARVKIREDAGQKVIGEDGKFRGMDAEKLARLEKREQEGKRLTRREQRTLDAFQKRRDTLESKMLEDRASKMSPPKESGSSGVQQVNAVNAPTTVNNNSNTAVYSDPSPATDDLDRASMAW